MSNDRSDQADKPTLTLIQRLKDGSLSPATLTKDQRQQCVEVLLVEGYSLSQIAQLIDRSEKTIKRDLIEIRQRNALAPSPELAKQLIGNFLIKVEAHQTRLMRLARGTDGSVAERAQAEYSAWRVLKESMEVLQTLGYLPLRPQQVIGDFVHRPEPDRDVASVETVEATIAEIRQIGEEAGGLLPEVAKELESLQQAVAEARLAEQAKHLLARQQQTTQPEEESP